MGSKGYRSRDFKIRPCHAQEKRTMLAIVNTAARAYEGVVPADCWHEPYMSADEIESEIAAGIEFLACEVDGTMTGVMGIQPVGNVHLIRHAYVLPAFQGHGVGGALLARLRARTTQQILVGTWAAATWAIAFYERHGFELVPEASKALLLRTYWTIPERQIETSVVLAAPRLTPEDARALVEQRGRVTASEPGGQP